MARERGNQNYVPVVLCDPPCQSIYRTVFNIVSRVFRKCIDFASGRSFIGLENSRHPLDQLDTKIKPTATLPLLFSRA